MIAGTGILGMRLTTGFVKSDLARERQVVQPELRKFAVAIDVAGSAPPAPMVRVRLLGGFAP